MQSMRYFLDTHDRRKGTFPEQLSASEFEAFYSKYEAACQQEGVVSLRLHVGLGESRAFCLNLAPDADAVRRAHARVGLPFTDITEITTATPGDMFFRRSVAA